MGIDAEGFAAGVGLGAPPAADVEADRDDASGDGEDEEEEKLRRVIARCGEAEAVFAEEAVAGDDDPPFTAASRDRRG
jgi:hypothetical protein